MCTFCSRNIAYGKEIKIKIKFSLKFFPTNKHFNVLFRWGKLSVTGFLLSFNFKGSQNLIIENFGRLTFFTLNEFINILKLNKFLN